MEWILFAALFTTIIGLFIWNIMENKSIARQINEKLEDQRNLIISIQSEINDFYHKLVWIEKNRK